MVSKGRGRGGRGYNDSVEESFWVLQRTFQRGSCDTEDWSNDTDNSALITGINYI